MNQSNETIDELLREYLAQDNELPPQSMAAILEEVRERDTTQKCVPRARLFREAPSGWNPEFQRDGHAAVCADCESAALAAFRKRKPGLWIIAPAERSIEARPFWWSGAVQRHLNESPGMIRLLAETREKVAAFEKSLAAGIDLADASRHATDLGAGGGPQNLLRSFFAEDPTLTVEMRPPDEDDLCREYTLSVASRNPEKLAEREDVCVGVSVFGKEHRIDKILRLKRGESHLLRGSIRINLLELDFLDPDIVKGGVPGVALLEPELLGADIRADNHE